MRSSDLQSRPDRGNGLAALFLRQYFVVNDIFISIDSSEVIVSDAQVGSLSAPSVPAVPVAQSGQVKSPGGVIQPVAPGVVSKPEAVKDPRLSPASLRSQLDVAIDELNSQMAKTGRALGFSYDEVAGQPVVKVMNKESGELLRQIPGEAVLRVAHSIESLKGVIYSNFI